MGLLIFACIFLIINLILLQYAKKSLKPCDSNTALESIRKKLSKKNSKF